MIITIPYRNQAIDVFETSIVDNFNMLASSRVASVADNLLDSEQVSFTVSNNHRVWEEIIISQYDDFEFCARKQLHVGNCIGLYISVAEYLRVVYRVAVIYGVAV